jgi:ATP-dependent DNA ligase
MQSSINTNTQARSIIQGSGPSLASKKRKEEPKEKQAFSMKLTEANLSSDKEHNGSRKEASKERHGDELVSSKKPKKIRKRKTTFALSDENVALDRFRTYPSIMKPAASYHPDYSLYQRQAEDKANLPPTAQDSCSTASPRQK